MMMMIMNICERFPYPYEYVSFAYSYRVRIMATLHKVKGDMSLRKEESNIRKNLHLTQVSRKQYINEI